MRPLLTALKVLFVPGYPDTGRATSALIRAAELARERSHRSDLEPRLRQIAAEDAEALDDWADVVEYIEAFRG